MHAFRHLAFAAAFACASSAPAQHGQGKGTWLYDVTTQDGDAVVEPGESATIGLLIDMDPGVGEQLPDGYFVFGFAGGYMDILGAANADKGQILGWEENQSLIGAIGPTGWTDGVSIFDVTLFQLFFFDGFDHSDPIHLLSFEWQPLDYGDFAVEYAPDIEYEGGIPGFGVFKHQGPQDIELEIWPIGDGLIQFQVVPAPAVIVPAAMILAAGAWSRRTRSADQLNQQP